MAETCTNLLRLVARQARALRSYPPACALLPPGVVDTGCLYSPSVNFDRLARHLRKGIRVGEGDLVRVLDFVNGSETALARAPLPPIAASGPRKRTQPRLPEVTLAQTPRRGDLVLLHPSQSASLLGGTVGLVLRTSHLDSLVLALNLPVEGRPNPFGGSYAATGGAGDPRLQLPQALRDAPLKYGGTHPIPLHLLHSVPLEDARAAMPQTDAWQRLTGHEVIAADSSGCGGLWCSFADQGILAAVKDAITSGRASPNDFGAFVGMIALEGGVLQDHVRKGYWHVLRPSWRNGWSYPVQGWSDHWGVWRGLLRSLGGEFAAWASVDWQLGLAEASPTRAGSIARTQQSAYV